MNTRLINVNGPSVALPSYRQLLGEDAWLRLHPDIQARFGSLAAHKPVVYRGMMKEVFASKMGLILAQLCRVIGTPLALHSGVDVAIEVRVYPDEKLGGMCWDRFYQFPNKKVNRVKSTKCIQPKEGLIEVVGCGFGMNLKVTESSGALCFDSTQFFWRVGRFKLPIPSLFAPGKTTVEQKALDNNQFQFSLTVEHALFGIVFHQVGCFGES